MNKTKGTLRYHDGDNNENVQNAIGCRGGSRIFFRRGCTRLLLYFNTNKPHSFFCRLPVVLENRRSSQKGGGVHAPCTLPLDPPLSWMGKTTTLHVHHAFLYISLPSRHDQGGKMPNFTFYGRRQQATAKFYFSFWTWIWFLGIRLKKSSLGFDKVNELE